MTAKIERIENPLNELTELRDNPTLYEERLAEVKAKIPYEWNKVSSVLNGCWLRGVSRPPDGRDTLDLLLVRGGKIIEIVPTTIGRYFRQYDAETGEYKVWQHQIQGGPSWNIQIDMLLTQDSFDTKIEIGDAVLLRISPLLYEGELYG